MLRLILFDFDGTLVDSIGGIWTQYQFVAKKMGLPEKSFKEFSKHLGKTWRNVLTGMWPDIDTDEFSKNYVIEDETSKPIPGVNNVLELLSKNYRLAILTSRGTLTFSQHVEFGKLKLEYFEDVLTRDDTKNHKPNPKVFDEVCEKFSVQKDEIIYVGDGVVDANCTKNAGVKFLGVLTGAADEKDFTDLEVDHIPSLVDLPNYLEEKNL